MFYFPQIVLYQLDSNSLCQLGSDIGLVIMPLTIFFSRVVNIPRSDYKIYVNYITPNQNLP